MAHNVPLHDKSMRLFPAGLYGHLNTKLLPANYPEFFTGGRGARMTDINGKTYIDYMCAFGLNLFGYADEEINRAYVEQLGRADALTGANPVMVDLAELFVGMVSHADWVIFNKNGTDATSLAAMVARAHTGREKLVVAAGSYHGAAAWCNLSTAGTTRSDQQNKIVCTYNDVESLEAAVRAAGDDLAAIFAAPFKHDAFVDQQEPDLAYAKRARELCDETGALLVIDDVRAGFKLARDCSWSVLSIEPDLSCWGKCIANGHPISALLGSDKVRDAAAAVYTTGSYWAAAAPMAAAIVTLNRIKSSNYLENIQALGSKLRAGLADVAQAHQIGFRQTGPVTMPLFLFDEDPKLRKGYFWAGEMLERGIYVHPWHNMFICDAMTDDDIRLTLEAADGAFAAVNRRGASLPPNTRLAD